LGGILLENNLNSAKVLQTKQIIVTKFLELLEHKQFKKITVIDICKAAKISRSTFYLHFEDKYELLKYCLQQNIEQWKIVSKEKTIEEMILYYLNSILEKRNFYYNTFIAESNTELTDIFQQFLSQFFLERITEKQQREQCFTGPLSIISAFYAGGVICSTIQWMQNGFNIPKEEIANCQRQLLSNLIE
jgi:AcrR family transcriptional regulator